jgi:hypothetical protein
MSTDIVYKNYTHAFSRTPEGTTSLFISDFFWDQFYWPKNSFTHNVGRAAGKVVKFFSKNETKTAALVSYWAVETFVYAMLLSTATSSVAFIAGTFLWLYGTYALFSLIK